MGTCSRSIRTRILVVHALAVPAALALLLPVTPAASVLPARAAVAQATWTVVSSPSPSTVASALEDVAVVPGTNVAWAVGYRYDTSAAAYRTLTMRNSGSGWSTVSSPNRGTGYNQFDEVDATATSNVWVSGIDGQGGNLFARYNGTQWQLMSSPSSGGYRDLDVLSSSEVWAVGATGSTTATARWRSGSWQVIPSLPGASRHLMVFEAVAARTATDVWAVGWDRDYSLSSRPVSSLIAHYDGSSWTRIPSPNPRTRNILYGVVALASDNVWAVGVAQNVGTGIDERSLLLHWNGTTWTQASTPQAEPDSDDQLLAVTAVSASSVWAVGYYSSPAAGGSEPLLLHWSSGAVVKNESPDVGASATLWGVSANSAGTVWAAGYKAPPSAASRTLTMRTTQG